MIIRPSLLNAFSAGQRVGFTNAFKRMSMQSRLVAKTLDVLELILLNYDIFPNAIAIKCQTTSEDSVTAIISSSIQ